MIRLKPRYKRRILWTALVAFGVLLLAFIIVPPMIHLDSLKPKIEDIILKQTGVPAKIHGKVNISLLGRTTIVAHNVSVPNGIISTCEFAVPLRSIFNMEHATISGDININGASFSVDRIVPFDLDTNVNIQNSKIKFLNKEYTIHYADLSKKLVFANINTDQHRYQITSINNEFIIKNKNNELMLTGTLHDDGSASAHINITAQNINRWFEFQKPKITGHFPITANIKWDGEYGFVFSDISADGVTGLIALQDDGSKKVQLSTQNADFDMSFILHDPEILKNASFDLDFYGTLKFADKIFNHLYINVVGSDDAVRVNKIIADNTTITGGTVDKSGGHNLSIAIIEQDKKTTCLFNGTPNEWSCDKMSYDNKIFGTLRVNRHRFDAQITSKLKLPNMDSLADAGRRFGNRGTIIFDFADASGVMIVDKDNYSVKYDFAKNRNLKWANIDMPFLPQFMMDENGDFVWQNDTMVFVPHSQNWNIAVTKDHFIIVGNDFKKWFPHINLKFMSDFSYTVSGDYKRGNVSNLTLEIAKHKFTGVASNKSVTLKTDILNMDAF